MPPKATATLTVKTPIDEAWPIILEVMQTARATKLKIDEEKHVVEAGSGASILSWGENVTVKATSLGWDQTEIAIQSVSSFKLTLIDYGKNKGNVDQLVKRLQERLPVTSPA